MEIFDVRCSRCGRQLYFIETTDEEERGLIFATPCQNCTGVDLEEGPSDEFVELQKEIRTHSSGKGKDSGKR